MTIDITSFHKVNIIDSCSIWNILCCNLFYSRALENQCEFSITKYVEYECLYKPRSNESSFDTEIKKRLLREINRGKFKSFTLSIADLQESDVLGSRRKLGMGELSSIAFAKRINQCFMTDDQGARNFGKQILGANKVQTTPQLLGYLIFIGLIIDGEVSEVITQHKAFSRSLEPYFKEVYNEALRIRCAHNPG